MQLENKSVVFAMLVSWKREPGTPANDERRPPLEKEYNTLKDSLPEGSVLYLARNEFVGIQYDAIVVLRGSLATIEDVMNKMNKISGFTVRDVEEPRKGDTLEEFFEWTQVYCGRVGASVYGPGLSVAQGDSDIQKYLHGLSGSLRNEDGAAEKLTQDMKRYQKLTL
jgi:hypothetical protein